MIQDLRLAGKPAWAAPARPAATPLPVMGPAAPAGDTYTPSAHDVGRFGTFIQDQGDTNGCGTTSLAMTLSFWKGKPEAYTRGSIDAHIRRANLPTSPQNVLDYARSQGMRAELKNDASLDELGKLVDQGVPVQVMIDPDGNGGDDTLHYVVVTGVKRDGEGKITGVTYADPAGGKTRDVDAATFEARWADLHLMGKGTGLSRLMIPMVPKADVAIRGKDGAAKRSGDIQLPKGGDLGIPLSIFDRATDVVILADKGKDTIGDLFGKVRDGIGGLFA